MAIAEEKACDSARMPRFETCQFALGKDGSIRACDPDAADKTGLPREDFKGKRLQEIVGDIHPDWHGALPDDLSDVSEPIFLPWRLPGGQRFGSGLSVHILESDGGWLATLTPALAPHNELKELSALDLPSEPETLAQLFLRLQIAEGRLENYMRNFPGVFFSQRVDLSFSHIGHGFEEMLGISPRPLYRSGGSFVEMLHEKDRDFVQGEIEKYSRQPRTFKLTYRARGKDEAPLYLLDVRTPRISPTGMILGYEGVWLDITRQSIAEDRLTRNAWKESLATLTNGLIHDFSNVMAGIYSISELYCADMEETHPWKRGMDQIKKHSMEARSLVRRIIDLNREKSAAPTYHNIENLIEGQCDLISAILPKGAALETALTGEELPVYLDDVSLRQTLLNLAMNSRDAVSDKGGKVKIEVRKVAKGETAFRGAYQGCWEAERDGVEIVFSDNGAGIPSEAINKLFEPFFTTKESQKGSGFGLYNARLFIEKSHGRIDVSSSPGNGASFYIYLPIADFTESLSEDEKRISNGSTHSLPKIAVYASRDPSGFEIVGLICESEWQNIAFAETEAMLRYLESAHYLPDIIFVIHMGEDAKTAPLLETLQSRYPGINRAVQALGRNIDELPAAIRSRADLVLDDGYSPKQALEALQELL